MHVVAHLMLRLDVDEWSVWVFINDDAQNYQWVDCPHTQLLRYLKNKKGEESKENTSGVSVKDYSKVKLVIEEFPITQDCKS